MRQQDEIDTAKEKAMLRCKQSNNGEDFSKVAKDMRQYYKSRLDDIESSAS